MSVLNALMLGAVLIFAAQALAPSAPTPKHETAAAHAIPDATIHAAARRYL